MGGADHGLKAFDAGTGRCSRALFSKRYGHSEWVTCTRHLPDGRILSAGARCSARTLAAFRAPTLPPTSLVAPRHGREDLPLGQPCHPLPRFGRAHVRRTPPCSRPLLPVTGFGARPFSSPQGLRLRRRGQHRWHSSRECFLRQDTPCLGSGQWRRRGRSGSRGRC